MRKINMNKKSSFYSFIHDTCMIVHHSKYSVEDYITAKINQILNEHNKSSPRQSPICYICKE
jgi:hypothetical protein